MFTIYQLSEEIIENESEENEHMADETENVNINIQNIDNWFHDGTRIRDRFIRDNFNDE